MLWGQLSQLLEDQVRALVGSFKVKNWEMLFEEGRPETRQALQDDVNKLAKELRNRLMSLNAISQELIQLVV
jgi:hypothetical protein